MRTFTVSQNQDNKRIDRVIRENFPKMPVSAMYKAFRKKDIKVNSKRVKDDHIVMKDDIVEVFIVDEILDGEPVRDDHILNSGFSIVFEDKNIIIVNKNPGVPVHPDREQETNTLVDLVQEYLSRKGEYDPGNTDDFPPSLCHRLDRNTGGLVILAKNSGSLKIVLDKIKNKEIKKFYQCMVRGKMEKSSDELKAFLIKDERKSRVFISDTKTRGAVEIITRYRTISYDRESDISKLEVELVTGRTHQIRAHLAHVGHPILGDGKYGSNMYNRSLGLKFQALWAYKVVFEIKNAGMLDYLKGRSFEVQPEFKLEL